MLKSNNEAAACEKPAQDLCDIFYTSNRKGHVFRVKLGANGFTLQRESPTTGVKEQTVSISDIVGGRCIRMQKSRRFPGGACVCSSSSSSRSVASAGASGKSVSMTAIDDGDLSAYLYIFAYVLKKKNLRSALRRDRTVLKLRFRSFDTFDENMREAERWYRALRWHKNHLMDEALTLQRGDDRSRRRLLVLLNPKSGSGKARELFHQQVVPILNEAELPFDLHVTKHANYAREFVHLRNLAMWCGIVAVGGDGLFYEMLNGLLQRSDWEDMLSNISLGIVPCGSGNGLARSIAHMYNEPYEPKPILGAALTIISGQSAPIDVVRIELGNQIVMFSFLSVGWGLISDIDIESERLRSLGYQRFTIWTLHRLISLRTYRGRVAYLVKSESTGDSLYPTEEQPKPNLKHSRSCNTYLDKADYNYSQSADCVGNSEFDDVISLETSINQSFRSRCDSWFSTGSRKSTYYSVSESIYHSIAGDSDCDDQAAAAAGIEDIFGPSAALAPPLREPIPEEWVVEEGEFIMVHAAYQTHLGIDCHFAPSAKLNDGTIFLVIIRGGIGRSQLLNFMINMSSGTHLPTKSNEFVKVVAVTAFRIEPYDEHGIITVDGERVAFGSVQGEMLPGIARVMVPK